MKGFIILILGLFLASLSFRDKEKSYPGFDLKTFEKSLVYIPSGFTLLGLSDSDLPYAYSDIDVNNFSFYHNSYNPKVDAFYMYNQEVSNGEYLEFLNDIKTIDSLVYHKMLPDTLVWRTKLYWSESLIDYYLRHPAYSNFPVVGISHNQAKEYCEWLTKKYARSTNRKFKNVVFKLPTLQQWVYAARGGMDLTIFPWKTNEMQDEKGNWLANFQIIDQKTVGTLFLGQQNPDHEIKFRDFFIGDIKSSLRSDCPIQVKSFDPNGYGLYQMAGNVSEYVSEYGIIKGGSWNTTGYYLLNDIHQRYDSTNFVSNDRGFRFIMEILE